MAKLKTAKGLYFLSESAKCDYYVQRIKAFLDGVEFDEDAWWVRLQKECR